MRIIRRSVLTDGEDIVNDLYVESEDSVLGVRPPELQERTSRPRYNTRRLLSRENVHLTLGLSRKTLRMSKLRYSRKVKEFC